MKILFYGFLLVMVISFLGSIGITNPIVTIIVVLAMISVAK